MTRFVSMAKRADVKAIKIIGAFHGVMVSQPEPDTRQVEKAAGAR
ncbi:hypothetical protein [Pseudomonas fluorescens]|nr:hypothetical protein [Pseudomonas fluorescens]